MQKIDISDLDAYVGQWIDIEKVVLIGSQMCMILNAWYKHSAHRFVNIDLSSLRRARILTRDIKYGVPVCPSVCSVSSIVVLRGINVKNLSV